MKLAVQHAGLTDRGRVRQENEDNWVTDVEEGLFIVADGMGGESVGALASKIVVATLPGLVRQQFAGMNELPLNRAGRWMRKSLAKLSTQLRQQTQDEPGLAGMGSTVVCALVRGAKVLVAHLGDSRVYRLRSGRLEQLTKDHSLVRLLLDADEITPEEAATHPARGRLTRNVGMEGQPLPQTRLLNLKPGDMLLLCTDGLTGMVDDQKIQSILNEPAPMELKCQRLVDAANQAGGEDNVTVLLLSVMGGEKKPDTNPRHAEPAGGSGSHSEDGKRKARIKST
jgi:PPM family protein phosphatase